MKIYKITFNFLVFYSLNLFLFSQEPTFVLLGYGEYKDPVVFTTKRKNSFKEATIKPQRALQEFKDTIPLKLGVEFGIDYNLITKDTNDNSMSHVIVKWIIPKEVEIDGKMQNYFFHEFATPNNKVQRVSIELPTQEELIPGKYTMIFKYSEQGVYQKDFYLIEN